MDPDFDRRRNLKIVRLIEPDLCLDCQFNKPANVETIDGMTQRMIYCRRLDCDNWDFADAERAKSITVVDESNDLDNLEGDAGDDLDRDE